MARIINLRQKPEVQPEPPRRSAPVQQTVARVESKSPAVVMAPTPHMMASENLAWAAHPHVMAGSRRYTTVFVVGLAVFAALVWNFQNNIIFACFLLLAALVMALLPRHTDKPVAVEIRAEGIAINDSLHSFRDLHSFWIDYTPAGIKELSLQTAHWYVPYMKVPLGDQNPNEVRGFLLDFIPEKEHEVSMVEAIARLIGH